MAKTSATKRLVRLLRDLHGVSGAGQTVGAALAGILSIAPNDAEAIQSAYLKLLRLVDASRDEVAEHYRDRDLAKDDEAHIITSALKPVDVVRSAVAANSVHSKVGVLANFDLGAVEILALSITKVSTQRELASEEIAKAKKQLEAALKVVLASELDARFKTAFSQLIRQIELSFDHYSVFGPDGVAEAIGILFARGVGFQATAKRKDANTVASALKLVSAALTIVYRGAQVASLLLGKGTVATGDTSSLGSGG